ncbi:hypothetical protein PMAYCL1PPCAC_18876 [Pristionchus mayeri]|uniref:Nhr-66 n=1 Tax=Pristionchus mayeri TaxID=1317129 RepID=A0AAN5CQA8_9BILA|nr:hypothetical protein PMAYCL1PPCAC_18876 [Pristionchus mayeri]
MLLGDITGLDLPILVPVTAGGAIALADLRLPSAPDSPPQNTSFSTATSSGVSSGGGSSTTARTASQMNSLQGALISNGEMKPKEEPVSREGSETGLDINGRPPVPLCSICSADSTGIHFGVEACAACSAFFRRTVVLSKNYECAKGGMCITHKDTGGSARCRACRFKKCISSGMDRNAVQHRRDAIGKVSAVKREGSPMDEDMSTINGYNMAPSSHLLMPKYTARNILDEWKDRHIHLTKQRKLFYTLSSLTDAFDESKDLFPPPTEMRNFSECIYQLWRIEPRLVADYVNGNAHTSHLPAHEKAALFRNFFMAFQAVEEPYLTWQHMGLTQDWWVMPNRMYFCFEHINMYFSSNIMSGLNLDMATAVRIFIPSFHHAMDLVARPMAALGVTYIEMIALSGIIYLDPMAPGISDETRIYLHKARGELLAALLRFYQEDLFTRTPKVNDSPEIRLSALLNICSGIRIHAERTRENMQILSLFDVIPCDNLFNEMCNIETAYSEEARTKLRDRAIQEDLVPMSIIEAADVKWGEYKRQVDAGILEKGTPINKMIGSKKETMSAPILERDNKEQMDFQLSMMRAHKKEESTASPDAPSIAPAAALAVAAVAPSVPSASLAPPQPLSLASFFPPQQSAAATAAASSPTLANLVMSSQQQLQRMQLQQPRIAVAPSSSARMNSEAVIQNILNNQQKADEVQKQQAADRDRRMLFPNLNSNEWINLTGIMQAAETNAAQQLERRNAATAAAAAAAIADVRAQQAPGPSSEKRARMVVVDSGTNPATPPSNSAMIAAALNAASIQQQIQQMQQQQMQNQMSLLVQVPLNGMNSVNAQLASQLLFQQQMAAAMPAVSMAALQQPVVSVAGLQQPAVSIAGLQQSQQQFPPQNPF